MFYQILPQSYYHNALASNFYAPNCFHTLQTLKYALEKSIAVYADSLECIQKTNLTLQTHQESREYHKAEQEFAHSPIQSESSDKLSQKDDQKLSIKISSQPSIEHIEHQVNPNSLSTEKQQNQMDFAEIGKFQLGPKQRLNKIQSLLSRRVDEFKIEKAKRKSSKIVYHWY